MNRVLKTALKVTASAVTLLVLVVGAGVGYTWYASQHSDENAQAFQQPSEPTGGAQNITPSFKPAEDAKVSASVQAITSPVVPGSNTSITIRTNPGATCTISVLYNKVASKDSGLVQKKADEFGAVEWTWTVEPSVPLGAWPVKIMCANAKNSAMVQDDLKVVETIE